MRMNIQSLSFTVDTNILNRHIFALTSPTFEAIFTQILVYTSPALKFQRDVRVIVAPRIGENISRRSPPEKPFKPKRA